MSRLKRAIFGAPRNLKDPKVFHQISLIAFLAWVGLGADGLSSSAYGPDEAFRALEGHTYLAVGLAVAMAFTVFIISYAYSRVIEQFPSGGGGYVVSAKLLGQKFGVVSGSALLVDYVLTISVSIAAAADQMFSVLPPEAARYKLVLEGGVIGLLMIMNLRGVKESVKVLVPIFLAFLVTHAILIFGGIASHTFEVGRVATEVQTGFQSDMTTIGLMGIFAIFIRAYSMGGGTYTGIEAVSNGLQIMREPKIQTAQRTMVYMAISLAITAGGILICYLLFYVTPEPGKTMNAVLLERFAGSWTLGNFPAGHVFIVIALATEAALLLVAALAGFIAGPRVMANMSMDSWLPHRFRSISDRLTMRNGVILISGAALAILLYTGGDTRTLVLMYSINVFLTFSLTMLGMVRYWISNRAKFRDWYRKIAVHVIGLTLCFSILVINTYEKFTEGGWVTLVITSALIVICVWIKRHYNDVKLHMKRLDEILDNLPSSSGVTPQELKPQAQTAVLLVNSYSGFGIHCLLTIHRLFPNHFKNFIFVSIGVIDSATLQGTEEVDTMQNQTEEALKKYVDLSHRLGLAADYRYSVGTEAVEEAEHLCVKIAEEFPRSVFFAGKLVFEEERWYQRLLHNETAYQIQRRLQFAGLNTMVLSVRVYENAKKLAAA